MLNKCFDNIILEYLPPVYGNIEEFKQLANAYTLEVCELNEIANAAYNNFFLDTLDSNGCSRWENILNLKVNSTYTLEDRRLQIKSKIIGDLPYTYIKLKQLLNSLLGKDNYEIKIKENVIEKNGEVIYKVEVKLNLGVKNQFNAVDKMLENIIPLNLMYGVELLYNTHEILRGYTHEELSRYTHGQLREEVLKHGNSTN